jgi:hypothetical protein
VNHPVEGWQNDSHLGIVVHRSGCSVCKQYALHVYQHEFEQEESYLNAVECQDVEISASAQAMAERQHDNLEEEITCLKNIIDDLDNKLDHMHEDRPAKHPHAHDPSLEQEWPARATTSQLLPSWPAPVTSNRPVADAMDMDPWDRDVDYPPLPRSSPRPRTLESVPPRPIHWGPAPGRPHPQATGHPQDPAEFDLWAAAAQTEGNEVDLQRVQLFVCLASLTPPDVHTPLMSHAISTWQLPKWLPVERQSSQGIRQMQNPDRVAQPPIHKSAEAWAQFMHRQLYQYQNAAGLILDQHQVSLPHVRGMLLMHQQVPAGLSQKQKHGLYLHLAEVFTTPGLYRQI